MASAATTQSRAESSGAPIQITSKDTRREGNLAIAQGDVVVAVGETTLYCDFAQYDHDTRNVLVSGNVRIFRNGSVFQGDRAIYNLDSKNFTGADFRTASGPFMAEAHTLSSTQPRVFEASKGFFTTDDVADPSFSIRAKTVRFLQDDRTEYENVTVYLGRVPVLWLPYLYQPADKAQSFSIVPGSRGSWGAFLLTRYAFPISDTALGEVRLDFLSKRGVAIGLDSTWQAKSTATSPSWGRFRSYYLNDSAPGTNPTSPTQEKIHPGRYRISLQDRTYLSDTVYTTVNFNKLSDINFLKDFLPHEVRQDPNPDTVFAVTKWDEDYTLTLQARARINRDFDGSGKLPELALDLKRQPFLDSGVFYEGESSVAKLSRKYGQTLGLTDFDTVREDTFHQWTYPKTLDGWLSIVTRVGVRATHYSSSVFNSTVAEGAPTFANGGALTRIAFNTGIEASFKLSRTFESVESRKWGLDGLRHIVQPFTDLSIVSVNQDASSILPFDHYTRNTKLPAINFPQFNSIDSITDWKILRLGVRNRIQTRRDDQTLNWLELESFIDTNIERPQFSKLPVDDPGTFSNFSNRLHWNPLPWLNFNLDGQLPLLDQGFTELNTATNFQVTRDLTLQLGNRYLSGNRSFASSNLVSGGARLRVNDNWALSFHNSYDFATSIAESQQYSIDRDLRSWIASLMLVVREQDAKKDVAVLLSLTLKDIPKISIPFKYDTGTMDSTGSGRNR